MYGRNGRRAWAWLGIAAALTLALYAHARWYGFVCDDGFISLRYARNWAEHGAIEYNLGERVEGYTNFAYVALARVLFALGLGHEAVMHAIGVLALLLLAGGLTWGTWLTATASARTREPWWLLLPGVMVASNASVAAWLLSGLETMLFGGLLLLGVVAAARATSAASSWRVPLASGVVLGLATLTRPEGGVFVAMCAAWVALCSRGPLRLRGKSAALLVAGAAALVLPHLCFRWSYYGALVPNTYYVKTSGVAGELAAGGMRYARLALRSFPLPIPLLWGLTLVPAPPSVPAPVARRRRVVMWSAALAPLVVLFEVLHSGGDFLGLWRFFAPVVPLIALGGSLGLAHLYVIVVKQLEARRNAPLSLVRVRESAMLLVSTLMVLALSRVSPTRTLWASEGAQFPRAYVEARIEPIHWTGEHARHWLALGRWIAERARPGDTMAMGAAGAAPFAAAIPNLDILGLCDAYIAKHGDVVSARPGHQRRAQLSYVLGKHPTFLFWDDGDYPSQRPLHYESKWVGRGYLWVEAELQNGAVHHFLLDESLAEKLRGTPHIRVASPRDP